MTIEELEAKLETVSRERAPTYHWLCVGCCEYAEDPDGMPAGWQWMPPGIPLCGECLASEQQRKKEAKP
jgi:hypothetical protein